MVFVVLKMYRIAFLIFLCAVYGQDEGEQCFKDGVPGTCAILSNCQPAIEGLKKRIYPQICGYSGYDSVVCCISSPPPPQPSAPPTRSPAPATTQRPPIATTQKLPGSTTQYVPMVYDYVDINGVSASDGCDPLSLAQTAKKTGQKAWDKCIEYQNTLVYPCTRSVALAGGMDRANNCMHDAQELIVGGEDAASGEFPHMVSLGFGQSLDSLKWECGGTIISEKFVLTAGHCTFSRDNGPVTHALIGVLNRTENVKDNKVYKIKNIIKHPDYKAPSQYNDIALLETEKTMLLNEFAVPACLNIGRETHDDRASATGWGLTEHKGRDANTLQKVILEKFTQPECAKKYPPARHLANGFDINTQMCFGDRAKSKDTCQGDSGGPLQIKSKEINCMYTVIGITSFGKACGFADNPGVYTRVSTYVPWIESVVWPDN